LTAGTVIRDVPVTLRSVRVFRAGGTAAASCPDGSTVALGAARWLHAAGLILRTGAVREVAERHKRRSERDAV
jgi:hypothetical protein